MSLPKSYTAKGGVWVAPMELLPVAPVFASLVRGPDNLSLRVLCVLRVEAFPGALAANYQFVLRHGPQAGQERDRPRSELSRGTTRFLRGRSRRDYNPA